MLQLTDGMRHAHDSYIVHRDLKPQNIMIKDDGQIKITGFWYCDGFKFNPVDSN